MDTHKPKMTVDLALAALKARPEQPSARKVKPPAEHPWKFKDENFNRMLDKGSDDFLNTIQTLIGLMIPVLPLFRGKPYKKDDVWAAAIAAGEKKYGGTLDYLERSEKDLFFLMIDDVMADEYHKNADD